MKKLLFTLLLLITCTITVHAQAEDLALPNYSPKELKKITKKANKGDVQSMKLLCQYYWREEHRDSMLCNVLPMRAMGKHKRPWDLAKLLAHTDSPSITTKHSTTLAKQPIKITTLPSSILDYSTLMAME